MKKIIVPVVLTFSILGLGGCAPGQNTPGSTIVGAAAGGLLGGAIFHSGVGVAAGALIGGSLGYVVGRQMDQQDQVNMMNAAETMPVNEEATWTNERTHIVYVVRPIRVYQFHGLYCRRFETRVRILYRYGYRWSTAYGTICRMPDGRWRIMRGGY